MTTHPSYMSDIFGLTSPRINVKKDYKSSHHMCSLDEYLIYYAIKPSIVSLNKEKYRSTNDARRGFSSTVYCSADKLLYHLT